MFVSVYRSDGSGGGVSEEEFQFLEINFSAVQMQEGRKASVFGRSVRAKEDVERSELAASI